MIGIISFLLIRSSGHISHICSWCQIKLWNLLVKLLTNKIKECGGGCIPTHMGGAPQLAVGSFPAATVQFSGGTWWCEVISCDTQDLFLDFSSATWWHCETQGSIKCIPLSSWTWPEHDTSPTQLLWLWQQPSHRQLTDNWLLCLLNYGETAHLQHT